MILEQHDAHIATALAFHHGGYVKLSRGGIPTCCDCHRPPWADDFGETFWTLWRLDPAGNAFPARVCRPCWQAENTRLKAAVPPQPQDPPEATATKSIPQSPTQSS